MSELCVKSGDYLSKADGQNRSADFEDVKFLRFHQRVLFESGVPDEPGHLDWGWTESERLDVGHFEEFREQAERLLTAPTHYPDSWGWEDPRTTLFLDFWDSLLEQARFVFVYRFPWDVADSMQRLGEPAFLKNPEYAYRIWAFYNRRLRDFYLRHADRCLLVSINALPKNLERFVFLLSDKLGLPTRDSAGLEEVLKAHLFKTIEGQDPLIDLVAAAWPDCPRLLSELDELADISGDGLWQAGPAQSRLSRPDATDDQTVELSVIIPCYEQGPLLLEAIASVERNAPPQCELIIVNDGSRLPRTLEILQLLKDLGYFVIDQENAGPSAARNRAIALARGRYILPLDDDNRIAAGFLDEAIDVLDSSPEIGIVYGDRYDFGLRHGIERVPDFDLTALLKKNYIDTCAVYRKQVWIDCGGYDPQMSRNEDWEFWIHAAERGWRFHRIPKVTFDYRVRPGSLISAIDTVEILDGYRKTIRMKHSELYWAMAVAQSETLSSELELVRSQLAERDCEAETLGSKLESMGSRLAELDGEVQQLRSDLDLRLRELQALGTRLAERDAEIARITGSLGWRLLSYYGGIKYRYLLPVYRLFERRPDEGAETKSVPDR